MFSSVGFFGLMCCFLAYLSVSWLPGPLLIGNNESVSEKKKRKTILAEIFGISESVFKKKLWLEFSATVTLSQKI